MVRGRTKELAITDLEEVSNGGETTIVMEAPYIARVELTGNVPLLFHAWNVEAVEAKANAAKGSSGKKSDDLESYVYRDEKGNIALPGMYVVRSIIETARYYQDPRSPRKSARDLFKAGIAPLTEFCSLGTKSWDFVDQRRVVVQRNAITRRRPSMNAGWKATVDIQVMLPHYIPPELLNKALVDAGRLTGVGDFRPSYGRFDVTRFEVLKQ